MTQALGETQAEEIITVDLPSDETGTVELYDLEVSSDDAQIKGGPGGYGSGGILINHNETTVEDEEIDEPLDDLAVADEEQVKGGPGGYSSGGVLINHNETIEEEKDEEAKSEAISDLSVQN